MIESVLNINKYIIFSEPAFIYLLIPLAVVFVLWLFLIILRRRSRPTKTYGSKYPFIGRAKFPAFFVTLAGALMILALARPYLAKESISFSRGDVELVVVVDRSISMRGDDIKESRLEVAKREALNIEPLLNAGDKVALFVFGRESHNKIYLTKKHNTVFERINNISFPKDLKGDGLVWDSDFAAMLEKIYQSLDRQDSGDPDFIKHRYVPKKRSNRVVVLISDGEDQFRSDRPTTPEAAQYRAEYVKRLDKALMEFRRRGLKIFPVGIGTSRGVAWLSLLRGYKAKEDYPEGLLKDWRGKVSRLDKSNLVFLATSSGANLTGHIWAIDNRTTTARSYIKSVLDSHRRTLPEFGTNNDENQLWQYFLLAAIAAITIGILSYPISGYFRKNKIK